MINTPELLKIDVPDEMVALKFIRETGQQLLIPTQREVLCSMLTYSWQTAYRYVWYCTSEQYRDTHTTLRGTTRKRIYRSLKRGRG